MSISKDDLSGRPGRYLGARGFRVVGGLLLLAGVAAAVGGPAYAVNGATQAGAAVQVPATLRADGDAVAEPFEREDVLDAAAAQPGVRVLDDGEVLVSAWDSTVAEQLLARGDSALLGLTVGATALLLLPVLTSIREGAAFRPGHARRLGVLAAVVAVYGVVAPLLTAAATASVLHRTGLSQQRVFEPDGATFGFLPFVVAVGLLVLAEAFRRGEQLADDVEGLV